MFVKGSRQTKQEDKKKGLLKRKHSICCGCFFHLAGGEPKKSLHERGEGRKQAHTCGCARSLTSVPPDHNPSTPQGKVWQRERDKGRRERERKEEIVGEIYRSLQQLTEGCLNLLLIVCAHKNKLDWRCWKEGFQRRLWASCENKQTTTYLP